VVEAVRSRKPGEARKVVIEHITRGEERISTALRAAGY